MIEDASFAAAYSTWRVENMPGREALVALRERAQADVARDVERMRRVVQTTHGLSLPDHVFTFLSFWRGLTEPERIAVEDTVGLKPSGVLDRLDTGRYLEVPTSGLDARLDWRFYADPPEFFTVLLGDSEGLHAGLWCDDSAFAPSNGVVASYYNDDPSGIVCNGYTLLQSLRWALEVSEDDLHECGSPLDDPVQIRISLAAVRDAVMEYETADRLATGGEYLARYAVELAGRIATVDEMGVWLPRPIVPEPRDTELIRTAIAGGSRQVPVWIEEALAACAGGQPSEALALGHDLHWMSGMSQHLEDAALSLLTAAYTALGRDTLSEIAKVHHQFRHLSSVDIYAEGT